MNKSLHIVQTFGLHDVSTGGAQSVGASRRLCASGRGRVVLSTAGQADTGYCHLTAKSPVSQYTPAWKPGNYVLGSCA